MTKRGSPAHANAFQVKRPAWAKSGNYGATQGKGDSPCLTKL